jgi:hypothetical protein
MKMEAPHSSTTSVTIYQSTRRNIPKDMHLSEYDCKNLTSHKTDLNKTLVPVQNIPTGVAVNCKQLITKEAPVPQTTPIKANHIPQCNEFNTSGMSLTYTKIYEDLSLLCNFTTNDKCILHFTRQYIRT